MSAIRTISLRRTFGELVAVAGLDLDVAEGEIFGLVGPDGAGKTTTMRLLTGILSPTGGSAQVAGFDVAGQSERLKEHIGYMSQRFGLYPDLTVMENIAFYADLYGVPRREREARTARLLGFSHLTPFQRRLAGDLSGGMKQKLGLALALINRPRILLLDEPTTGVDPVTRQDFWRLIIGLLQEESLCVLVSTPYMDEAARCKRVGFLRGGKLISEGTPRQLRSILAGRILELSGSPPELLLELARAETDVETVQRFGSRYHLRVAEGAAPGILQRLGERIPAAGGTLESLCPIEAQLEDVFIALSEELA